MVTAQDSAASGETPAGSTMPSGSSLSGGLPQASTSRRSASSPLRKTRFFGRLRVARLSPSTTLPFWKFRLARKASASNSSTSSAAAGWLPSSTAALASGSASLAATTAWAAGTAAASRAARISSLIDIKTP
ncbi:hypothetical protein D3C84_823360 [compost metagenome]